MSIEALTTPEIERRFTYHRPIGNQPQRYECLREKAKELAILMRDLCPASLERSKAMTDLQQCVMWANASIAINETDATSHIQSPWMNFEQEMAKWKALPVDVRVAKLAAMAEAEK